MKDEGEGAAGAGGPAGQGQTAEEKAKPIDRR